ncbi:E3 ubiquitin-protein ligase Os06g0535400-like [Salvia hispanica]|uniref:E3 ubiquitin-protein ligase Os06g0535400-like n=1 Tax=Salvia hispanica TaxID=49212 RepID=UPI002009C07D|nr:E3 ubiquitin-protein ligase Os06g0535400-like [Salvia hispanica]
MVSFWVVIAIAAIVFVVIWILDDDDPPRHEGDKAELHEKLEKIEHDVVGSDGSLSEAGCTICLEGYVAWERRATINTCGHRFHAHCIEAWLRENNTCPLCRHHLV